jgi:hypothetical protein
MKWPSLLWPLADIDGGLANVSFSPRAEIVRFRVAAAKRDFYQNAHLNFRRNDFRPYNRVSSGSNLGKT